MADKNHVFLVERTGYHALRLVEREGKADIDGLLLDQAMNLCRMLGLDEELRAWMAAYEGRIELRERIGIDGIDSSDPELPESKQALNLMSLLLEPDLLVCQRQEHLSFWREQHFLDAALPDQERHAELLFELRDAHADRSLADKQLSCCFGEAAAFSHFQERLDSLAVHCPANLLGIPIFYS